MQDDLRRKDDVAIQIMSERVNTIHADMQDLKTSLKESITAFNEAVNKLVRMEEKQTNMTQAYDRLVKEVDKAEVKFIDLEKRIDALEKEAPMQKQINKWILGAVWSLAMAAAAFVAKFVGLI